jgi:ribonuclease Z
MYTSIVRQSRQSASNVCVFLAAIAAISPLQLLAQDSYVDQGTIRVTILGVGAGARGGNFDITDSVGLNISTLVEVEDKAFLFDAGRGALDQISKLGGRHLAKITHVYLTHLHGDHNIGLPDLWLSPIRMPEGGRTVPLQVFGPAGTEQMAFHIATAFDYSLFYNGNLSATDTLIGKNIQQGVVYEEDGITITAFDVDHSPPNVALDDRENYPALGFRVDYASRSVVISGDTRFSENLIQYSQGADVLIHEVGGAGGGGGGGMGAAGMGGGMGGGMGTAGRGGHHTSILEAGEVFNRVQPKLAVYSHFPRGINQVLIDQTRSVYDGALLVGTEMTVITIGESVEVTPGNDDPSTALQPAVGSE